MDSQISGIGILGFDGENPSLIACEISWDLENNAGLLYVVFLSETEKVIFGKDEMPVSDITFGAKNTVICDMFYPELLNGTDSDDEGAIIPIKIYISGNGYTLLQGVAKVLYPTDPTSDDMMDISDSEDIGGSDIPSSEISSPQLKRLKLYSSEPSTDTTDTTTDNNDIDTDDIDGDIENEGDEDITNIDSPIKQKRGWFSWFW